MATEKQRQAAKKNIKKAQRRWKSMSARARSKSQPEGRDRKKSGTTGQGNYYHVEVRPKGEFTTFRTQDVGEEDAHVEDGRLVGDTKDARDLIRQLGSEPVQVRGDRFEAKPRRNVPEREKPSAAQQRARRRKS